MFFAHKTFSLDFLLSFGYLSPNSKPFAETPSSTHPHARGCQRCDDGWRPCAGIRYNISEMKGKPFLAVHGHATRVAGKSPEYRSFESAKQRCTNPRRPKYEHYGGRGIEFRFANFVQFLAEIGERPQPKHLYTLDRINTNGHYEPGNVRWATREEQARNTRPNRGQFKPGNKYHLQRRRSGV